jgi:hypothetical protein
MTVKEKALLAGDFPWIPAKIRLHPAHIRPARTRRESPC